MKVKIFKGFKAFSKSIDVDENNDVSGIVQEILKKVHKCGDAALREYTEKFDKATPDTWLVPENALEEALDNLGKDLLLVLQQAADNIMFFHERQKTNSQLDFSPDGSVLGWKVTPVDSAGIYVPGGRATYPSTLLMNAIPAQIAEVPRIAIVSPPGSSGLPHPLIMAAAAFMGLKELYAVGGVQSIAALAYGTESIEKVVKITGPGNAYVVEAKRQLYGIVGIDSLAGPSEIMIVSDRQDIPVDYIVRDMLSQAEHDPDAGAFLVTTSENQAKKVAERIKKLVPKLPRKEIIEASFSNRSAIILSLIHI